jgi:hypothetical protein
MPDLRLGFAGGATWFPRRPGRPPER